MRFAWLEIGLAVVAVGLAGMIGWALQREDPSVWAMVGSLLFMGRLVLR